MKIWVGILLMLSVFLVGCDPEFYSYNQTNTTDNESMNVSTMDNMSMDDMNESMSEDSDAAGSTEPSSVSVEPVTSTGPVDATFVETDLIALRDTLADDPDGDDLRYAFTPPLSEDGEWQTRVGDAGVYEVTITASDGKLISTRTIRFEVLPLNNVPVITNFNDVTVKEGETVKFNPVFTDADGDKLTFSFNGWMSESSYRTTFDDAGEHAVTLSVSDGKATETKTVTVTVLDVNREPVIIELKPREGIEGDLIAVSVKAEDPDDENLTITYGEPLDSLTGTWRTRIGDEGEYFIPVVVSDGVNEVEQEVKVTVLPRNKPPVISGFEDITVTEGETVELNPTIEDPEGEEVTVTYSGWMDSNIKATDYDDAGEYTVRLSVSDGETLTIETITVTVLNNNRAPVFREDLFE